MTHNDPTYLRLIYVVKQRKIHLRIGWAPLCPESKYQSGIFNDCCKNHAVFRNVQTPQNLFDYPSHMFYLKHVRFKYLDFALDAF